MVEGVNCAFWDSPSITKRFDYDLVDSEQRDGFIQWLSGRSGSTVSLLGIYSTSGDSRFKNFKVMDLVEQQEE